MCGNFCGFGDKFVKAFNQRTAACKHYSTFHNVCRKFRRCVFQCQLYSFNHFVHILAYSGSDFAFLDLCRFRQACRNVTTSYFVNAFFVIFICRCNGYLNIFSHFVTYIDLIFFLQIIDNSTIQSISRNSD